MKKIIVALLVVAALTWWLSGLLPDGANAQYPEPTYNPTWNAPHPTRTPCYECGGDGFVTAMSPHDMVYYYQENGIFMRIYFDVNYAANDCFYRVEMLNPPGPYEVQSGYLADHTYLPETVLRPRLDCIIEPNYAVLNLSALYKVQVTNILLPGVWK